MTYRPSQYCTCSRRRRRHSKRGRCLSRHAFNKGSLQHMFIEEAHRSPSAAPPCESKPFSFQCGRVSTYRFANAYASLSTCSSVRLSSNSINKSVKGDDSGTWRNERQFTIRCYRTRSLSTYPCRPEECRTVKVSIQ